MNILEILKTKPHGTRLWSPVFGNVRLNLIDEDDAYPVGIKFFNHSIQEWEKERLTCAGRLDEYDGAECILFPSKNMRDWEKFTFKKGDVLHVGAEKYIVFDRYDKDDYSRVFGKFRYDKSDDEVIRDVQIHTSKCEKTNAINASLVVASIETHLGGKLNLDTLEIERPQCQFKPFDKVLVRDSDTGWHIDFFEMYNSEDWDAPRKYECIMGKWSQCIPYAGNEHLLGTTDSPSNDKEAAQ